MIKKYLLVFLVSMVPIVELRGAIPFGLSQAMGDALPIIPCYIIAVLGNMIPVPITELEPYIITDEKDLKYRQVILGELRYINSNAEKIVKYAKIVYNQKIKNIDIGYIKNTVDFKVLEEKLNSWNENQ